MYDDYFNIQERKNIELCLIFAGRKMIGADIDHIHRML